MQRLSASQQCANARPTLSPLSLAQGMQATFPHSLKYEQQAVGQSLHADCGPLGTRKKEA